MAYASIEYASVSGTTFALTNSDGNNIPYIKESDITVKVNDVVIPYGSGGGKYLFNGAGTSIILGTSVTNAKVEISRGTSIVDPTVTYTAGSTLVASDLNNADNQIRYGLQEFSDKYDALFTGNSSLSTAFGGFLGSTDTWASNDTKAATTGAIDARVDAKTTAKVKDDIIATAPVSIADDSPSAGKITISVDAELTELATMSTGTAQALADLTGTEVQILDGATLTTTELNYVDGVTSAVQTQIDGKQAADADLTAIAALSSADGNVIVGSAAGWVAESGATARTSLGAQTQDADLDTLSGMQTGAAAKLAALTATEVEILDGLTATTAQLNYVDATSAIQSQIDGKQPADADLTTLAGMQAGTASILAGGTALTSTLTELNQLDGKTLGETSLTTNSDTKIPTSKAVADHVASSVTAVGGLVAIAGPTNFPATQPAQGVVVSIGDVGSGFTTSSNEITITNGAGTGNNVRITGFPTSLAATTLQDDTGIQVTSDKNNSTSGSPNVHRYVYHKWLAKEDDIKQLSDDINEFNERYRTDATGNNPSSNNHAGDLFFNQGSNTMYVRNGANNAWAEVTSSGDFKLLFLCPKNGGSGAPTFDSNEKEFDLRETSNSGSGASVTSAAQLTISVNGVVQKPNAGTNESGLDGFVLADSNTIKFCQAPVSGDEVFVIQSGSAVTLNAPANNTVATDTLQSQAVTEAKILISNSPSDGKFLQYKDSSDKLTWADVPAGVGGANGADFNDDVKARFGTGNDLEIYHDGSNSYIKDTGTGALRINASSISFNNPGGTEAIAGFAENGAVELFYDNVKKFETVTGGVTITGVCTATSFAGDGSALTGIASTSLDGCGYQNDQTISAGTYSIAANKGMHSVGPITNNGTVTVSGTWVIS